jgi:hypothetical protein
MSRREEERAGLRTEPLVLPFVAVMGFAETAVQNAMPAIIHSATSGSGFDVTITFALALWC